MAQSYVIKTDGRSFEMTADNLDLLKLSDTHYQIINQNRNHKVELVSINLDTKMISLELDGELFELQIEESLDQQISKMGFESALNAKIQSINSPMPGLVLDVMVTEGQEVAQGDSLLILEAMKMENVIKSPIDAKIQSINVSKGDSVEKSELLILFE